ncbi:hypothetical protein ACFV84_35255 [Kitasatospora sp. NPDC059811]|uniref:hypothetical protein n=1 Tax=Streptomycetaceae TaxID=2062 RepID=UPI0007AF14ED|nr:hypothetical protein [Streptomyces sp. MJM8645]
MGAYEDIEATFRKLGVGHLGRGENVNTGTVHGGQHVTNGERTVVNVKGERTVVNIEGDYVGGDRVAGAHFAGDYVAGHQADVVHGDQSGTRSPKKRGWRR